MPKKRATRVYRSDRKRQRRNRDRCLRRYDSCGVDRLLRFPRKLLSQGKKANITEKPLLTKWFFWSWWRDSDPRPIDYESIALPLRHTSTAPTIAGAMVIISSINKIVNIYFQERGALSFNAPPILKLSRRNPQDT